MGPQKRMNRQTDGRLLAGRELNASRHATPRPPTDARHQNLRKMSYAENLAKSQRKAAEIKGRKGLEARDDLCEMLGRGC